MFSHEHYHNLKTQVHKNESDDLSISTPISFLEQLPNEEKQLALALFATDLPASAKIKILKCICPECLCHYKKWRSAEHSKGKFSPCCDERCMIHIKQLILEVYGKNGLKFDLLSKIKFDTKHNTPLRFLHPLRDEEVQLILLILLSSMSPYHKYLCLQNFENVEFKNTFSRWYQELYKKSFPSSTYKYMEDYAMDKAKEQLLSNEITENPERSYHNSSCCKSASPEQDPTEFEQKKQITTAQKVEKPHSSGITASATVQPALSRSTTLSVASPGNSPAVDQSSNPVKSSSATTSHLVKLQETSPGIPLVESVSQPATFIYTSRAIMADGILSKSIARISAFIPVSKANLPVKSSTHLKKESKCFNLLVLGETGVGKSTFTNSLLNYLSYDSYAKATENCDQVAFYNYGRVHATDKFSDDIDKAEFLNEKGESSTQIPKLYKLPVIFSNSKYLLNILDTPGINDTEGLERDKRNKQAILNRISKIERLHAICILIKPNQSRLTADIRYCLENILQFHRDAVNNLFFCFTNAPTGPGETLSILRSYFEKIKVTTGLTIPLNSENTFCFENSCFRYLCIVKQKPGFSTTALDNLNSVLWAQNVKNANRLISKLERTLSFSTESTVILSKVLPLTRIFTERAMEEVLDDDNHIIHLIGFLHILLKNSALIVNGDAAVLHFQETIEKIMKTDSCSEQINYLTIWLNWYADLMEEMTIANLHIDFPHIQEFLEMMFKKKRYEDIRRQCEQKKLYPFYAPEKVYRY